MPYVQLPKKLIKIFNRQFYNEYFPQALLLGEILDYSIRLRQLELDAEMFTDFNKDIFTDKMVKEYKVFCTRTFEISNTL